jgi:tRNA pseudouridine13 synthase
MYRIKQLPEDFIVTEINEKPLGGSGNYTYFLLKKRNVTTEGGIRRVAGRLNLPRTLFGYAGTKDKVAVTEQLCCVKAKIRDMQLGDVGIRVVGRGDTPISLGDLTGNSFVIKIRNIDRKPRHIDRIVNYFDSQRFGVNDDNQLIGRSILRGNFRAAVERVVSSQHKTDVKDYLASHPHDFVGALRTLPKHTLLLYIHAYQSYLWNECARDCVQKNAMTQDATLPLVGFGTEYNDDFVERTLSDLLEKDGLSLRDFVVRSIPELSSEGTQRNVFADVNDLEIGGLEEDELNSGMKMCTVSFWLSKGSYATVVISSMFGS